ncbi:3-oxoacyl-[acyl-carrier-protein] synthase 3 [Anaerohalosphaera lusitana]|uniref:Beta-ketoacyl-[acyl-carrier-protein] synthase III n=1 Tax=Anaerohalosphaera lusitana TaxID=1936003 RepID=A0A1U9NNH1_9BACT|nr:beta-ketoacyl-ACP synthase III [Anaerohalosphaera lusitana]AQT69160.1 3-oxoacyl-[acyl-carrier-protein] synthase 3 [Anaerohalosphaera lusitana]
MNEAKLAGEYFNAVIAGTGSAVPENTLTNEDLTKIVDTSDEWISTRTGMKVRHISGDDDTTATLAASASKEALADAGVSAEDVDLIICATITPEMVFPSTACFVQDMIGAKNAWAFDLSAACSGFVYALSVATRFVTCGKYDNVLVIGAETLSKITDYEDRNSCVLFGDGAGAVVLKKSEQGDAGVKYSCSWSDGSGWTALNCQAYGSRHPVSKPLDDPKKVYMNLNGREVYQTAVRRIVELVNECLNKCNLDISDIDMFIPHQMNARIIESVAKRLKFGKDNVFINIEKYGNTSAASIPLALDDCIKDGKVKSGDTILLAAFGAGLTWGATVIQL